MRHCKLWIVFGVAIWQVLSFVMFLSPSAMYLKNREDVANIDGNTTHTDTIVGSEASHQSAVAIEIDKNLAVEGKTLPTTNNNNQESDQIHFSLNDQLQVSTKSTSRIRRTLQNNIHTIHKNMTTNTNTQFTPSTSCPHNLLSSDISVSLLTQSSVSRLRTLDTTCQRWKSPIIVVVAVLDPLNNTDSDLLQGHISKWKRTCKQLKLIMYHLDKETEGTPDMYPINTLRNIALEAVSTSHILMIDVDFIPSNKLDRMICLSISHRIRVNINVY